MGQARCRTRQVRYYLLEEELEPGGTAYGVGIALEGETAEVRDLSPSRQRVEELARALVRGVVTPVALGDVVDDWLAE